MYENGRERCRTCNILIKWDGLWCPCCGRRQSTRILCVRRTVEKHRY